MRKIRNQELYKVINTQTGEIKSNGSTKEDAKKQLRLLKGLEKKEGGMVWKGATDPEFLKEYMRKKAEIEKLSGGALKASQIKDIVDLSYKKGNKDKAPAGYTLDKELSDDRVKVYKDLNSQQVIVAHRGSDGWRDWLDNARYAFRGDMKSTGTYKEHKKKHDKALDKYGADNVIAVGHSRAGKYVEELNKDRPVKEVLTYNKAAGLTDVLRKNPKNQTDIRTSRDLVSMLNPFQRNSNKVVTIDQHTFNPLKSHGTSGLEILGEKLVGQGFKGKRFNSKKLRVGDMRKFIKLFKKHQGEKFTGGAKITKKGLCEMIQPILMEGGSFWKDFGRGFVKGFTGVLDIAKVPIGLVNPAAGIGLGALSTGVKGIAGAGVDEDELTGGSIWTDFVKEFSAKHGLKYACSLSKYKEPLKKAYKLKKENKDWYEPFTIDKISGENISMTIEEPKPVVKLISDREKELQRFTREKLVLVFKKLYKGNKYELKQVTKMYNDHLIRKILEKENVPEPKPEPKPDEKIGKFSKSLLDELDNETTFPILVYQTKSLDGLVDAIQHFIKKGVKIVPGLLFQGGNNATHFLNSLFTYWTEKIGVLEGVKKIDIGIRSLVEYLGGGDRLPEQMDYNEYLKPLNAKNKKILYDAVKKSVIGSGVMSGGANKWTNFVKDYAKSYNTTYGCAMSDFNIKGAYKLFKDGKEWYVPKSMDAGTGTDDGEFIEPVPVKAPENIEPVVNRIEEKIKELEELGRKKGAVSYNASVLVSDIAFVNLMKKYGGRCIVNHIMKTSGIDMGIDLNNNRNNSEILFKVYYQRLGEALQECISRGVSVIAIPLSLKFGNNNSGHANMLIYRPFKRIVERFEPHGTAFGNSMVDNTSFNDQLKELWEDKLKDWIGDVRFKTPDEICPNPRGFQALEGSLNGLASEGGGFCSMWSIFLTEMVFINPSKSTKEIIEEVFEISAKEPAYLKSLIRGYVLQVEKGLDELLTTMGKSGFSYRGTGMNAPYMKIAGDIDGFSKWLLALVFDSKKYSEAPPGYEPLPGVVIKEKSDIEKLKETYINKMRSVKVAELKNIYSIYGLKMNTGKRDDIIYRLITQLIDGDLNKYGATGITDIDVILDEELHKKKGAFRSGLAREGYFKNSILQRINSNKFSNPFLENK